MASGGTVACVVTGRRPATEAPKGRAPPFEARYRQRHPTATVVDTWQRAHWHSMTSFQEADQ